LLTPSNARAELERVGAAEGRLVAAQHAAAHSITNEVHSALVPAARAELAAAQNALYRDERGCDGEWSILQRCAFHAVSLDTVLMFGGDGSRPTTMNQKTIDLLGHHWNHSENLPCFVHSSADADAFADTRWFASFSANATVVFMGHSHVRNLYMSYAAMLRTARQHDGD
jgi:hypothetical protein